MSEKRSFLRFAFEDNISWKTAEDISQAKAGKLLDISFLGMSIFTQENIAPNLIINFNCPKVGGEHLIGQGKIVNVEKYRLHGEAGFKAGVEFVKVNKATILKIIEELDRRAREEAKRKWLAEHKNLGPI